MVNVKVMLDSYPLEHLRTHLHENHDSDWRFEFIDFFGTAFNCYLPTDSPKTYIIISHTEYTIVATGENVPQGLIDEIETVLQDGFQIYVGWEGTNFSEVWA